MTERGDIVTAWWVQAWARMHVESFKAPPCRDAREAARWFRAGAHYMAAHARHVAQLERERKLDALAARVGRTR